MSKQTQGEIIKISLNTAQASVLFEITLSDKPVTRQEIMVACHLSDRQVRKTVQQLRKKGFRICSGNMFPGYWPARSDVDYQGFERQYLSQAYDEIATAKAMRKNQHEQMTLE